MATQFSLDFNGALPIRAQIGMERADQNADPKWKHVFDACVLAAARRKPEITSDDVLEELRALPNAPSTHNLAAIGPAMKRAARMGVLTRTDRFTRSKVQHKNGNIHAVWISNHYRAADNAA